MHLNETHKKQARTTDAKQDRRQAGYKKTMPRNQVIFYTPFLEFYGRLTFLFEEHHLGYKVSAIKEI